MSRCHLAVVVLTAATLAAPTAPTQDTPKRPMTVEDLWAMGRLADPELAPDGRAVAFAVTEYDMDRNRGATSVHLVPREGGPARRLTAPGHSAAQPRFAPDGKFLYFLSARGGPTQVWRLPLEGGGEAEPATRLPVEVTGFQPAPDGRRLLVTALVYPGAATVEESAKRHAECTSSPSSARVYTRLLYRHWNQWRDERRSHVLLVDLEDASVRDLTSGDFDTPPVSLEYGAGYTLAPDGETLCFTRNATPEPATNTNNDIFSVFTKGGEAQQVTRTQGNDHCPQYAPSGRMLAFLSMARAGFEADRNVLMVREQASGKVTPLTAELDRSVTEYVWSPDSRFIYFAAADEGRTGIYEVSVQTPRPRRIYRTGTSRSLGIGPDGKSLVFLNQAFDRPAEVWSLDIHSGQAMPLSHINDAILARLELGAAREFWFKGARDADIHAFLLTPPGFNPATNYPAVMLLHGGPQGAFMDEFHWRWNAQLWVAQGHVGLIVNFHGSSGYGQKFTDAVSGDWGGAPCEDVLKGLDHAVKRFAFIDGNRVGAAGGSYGGFLANWICGQTDRFKCLISHAGLAEHWSMFGATEEIWFPLWEFGGAPWDKPELHERFSPVRHAASFRTPTLLIHGEHDYRVPYTQALQMFTALQMRGVKSKLLLFPDESHFITRPQNARVWWNTIHAWLAEHLGGVAR